MKYSRALWATAATVALAGSVAVPSFATAPTSASGSEGSATAADVPGVPGPACSWSAVVGSDGWNLFYPEGSANYWIQPYIVSADTTVQIDGTYPDANYLQMATYQEGGGHFTTGDGVESWLTDYELEPSDGSANPFAQEGAEPGGSFSLTVSDDAAPGDVNTLPMAPDGTPEGSVGYVVFRVYNPAGGDFSTVDLPEVSMVTDGVSTTLPQCDPADLSDTVPDEILDLVTEGSTDTWTTQFSRQELGGLFPNADTGYVERTYDPKPNDVLVVHGKGPVQSGGESPVVWPDDGVDTRFWSICTGLPDEPYETTTVTQEDGTTELGCASDDETQLDEDGYYTYVIGTEDQREQIEQIPGATFVPLEEGMDSHKEHVVVLRNMLPAEDFEEAAGNVPLHSDPATTKEIMGDYYPESEACSLTQLEKNGVGACL